MCACLFVYDLILLIIFEWGWGCPARSTPKFDLKGNLRGANNN